jgi:hypothetical protein
MAAYLSDPEVKAKKKAYMAQYYSDPENKAKRKAQQAEYYSRYYSENKARWAEDYSGPENKAKRKAQQAEYYSKNKAARKAYNAEYHSKPENKAKVKARKVAYLNDPDFKAKRKAHQASYNSSVQGVFRKCRSGARQRDIPFELTPTDVDILIANSDMKCSVSGVSLSLNVGDPHKASIDRIDSSMGYVYDNVQIVSTAVNRMKLDLKHWDFIELCRSITKHNEPVGGV